MKERKWNKRATGTERKNLRRGKVNIIWKIDIMSSRRIYKRNITANIS